jgi:hypothetical protein
MSKLKKINPGEEFCLCNQVFVYSIEPGGAIKLRKVREVASKPKGFVPPALEEVSKYFMENGYPKDLAEKFYKGYEAGNPPWSDSTGKPIRAWKQKAIQVWFKPEAKIKNQHGGTSFFKE